jgi:hypothetical protein
MLSVQDIEGITIQSSQKEEKKLAENLTVIVDKRQEKNEFLNPWLTNH